MRSTRIFVLSKVDLKSWNELKNKYSQKKSPSPQMFQNIKQISDIQFNESKSTVFTTFEEKIPFSFSDIIKGIEVPIVTEILLRSFENSFLMISSSSGLGMMVRGDARNYIDTIIAPLFVKILDIDVNCYHPIRLPKSLMVWTFWGEELRNIVINIPEFGLLSLKGRNMDKKIANRLEINSILSKGDINEIKVHSKELGRTITVSRHGTLKIQLNDFDKFADFLIKRMEMSSILG